jgi:hypothetical protein
LDSKLNVSTSTNSTINATKATLPEYRDITDTVTVKGGGYQSEIRWKLTCGNEIIIKETTGRAPYNKKLKLPGCTSCRVDMRDTYGDGWSSNYWSGFGYRGTVTKKENKGNFTTAC